MENKSKDKKDYKIFAGIILTIFLIIYLIILIISTMKNSTLSFFEWECYIMQVDSQENIAQKGDLVIAKKIPIENITEDDIIIYTMNNYSYMSNVDSIQTGKSTTKILVKETDNVTYKFSTSDIDGVHIKTIPKLGNIILFLQTTYGIILIISTLLILFVSYKVIKYARNKNKI